MSDSTGNPDDRAYLAAEYALGLLDGAELRAATTLADRDPDFRAEVALWSGYFAPLLDEIDPATPPEALWRSIERRILAPATGSGNVVQLRRSRNLWRGATVALSAIAAALALYVATGPGPQPIPAPAPTPTEPAPAEPMVASLSGDEDRVLLVATWDPGQRRLLMTAAADIPPDPGRAHELWVIPSDGTPRSLGLLPAAPRANIKLDAQIAGHLAAGATLAVSVEPESGSPTGLPTGPVVASGPLERA